MIELYDIQQDHTMRLYEALRRYQCALDASDTGTGKTYCAAAIATRWSNHFGPIVVVCPKAVITSWTRVFEQAGVTDYSVINYEKIRTGNHGHVRIKSKRATTKIYEWLLPDNALIIFDEVQATKGGTTQNAQLLIAARKQDIATLSLSATAAKDPTHMRALGYSLRLHNLNDKQHGNSFVQWLRRNGCYQDPWNNWKMRQGHDLSPLRRKLYDEDCVASAMRVRDMPDEFRGNRVIVEVGDYKGAARAYDECGITQETIDTLMGDLADKRANASNVIVDLLRARQQAETLKVPHFIDRTRDLLDEGKSVVVFLNFQDSIEAFRAAIPDSGVVIGGQDADERTAHVDAFQENKTRVLVVSAQAGGAGLSLHDLTGDHPRVSLISPTFSEQVYKQVLGRIYRAGMQSDALQIVMLAADTVEEHVHKLCSRKIESMETMLGS